MSVPTTALPWPILPRPESETIASALAHGRSVVLVGDVGVGKSRLAASAVARLTASGATGRGPAGRPTARRVVSLSGASLTPDLSLEGVSPILRALLRGQDADDDPAAPEAAPADVPLLRIEDAHRLDHRTAHTLAALARQRQAQLVITSHNAGASQTPWLELWKDGIAERVDVAPLGAAQVEELLTMALGGPLTTATCVRVMARSQGNPFYLRELVRAELETGTLVERRGVWVGLADAAPGPRVVDMVRHELDRLDPPVREALDLVALADDLPVSRLSGLVLEGALDELVRRGMVVIGQSRPERSLVPVVQVRHPMYGEAVRELVPPDRRRRLYGAVRGSLSLPSTAHQGGPAALLRMALWALECGVHESPDRLLAALRAALETGRWDMAEQVAAAAMDAFGPAEPGRADALLMRAAARYQLDRPVEAARDLADAAAVLAGSGGPLDPELRVRLVEQLADLDQFHDDDPDRALGRIESAQHDLADTSAGHVRALEISRLARLGHAGRFAESLGPSLAMLAAAAPTDSAVLRLVAPAVYGLGQLGRADEADLIASRHVRHAMARPDPAHRWLVEDITVAQGLALLWAGEVDRVAMLLDETPEQPLRYSTHEVFAQVGQGMLAAARGLWSEARGHLARASARYSVRDISGVGKYVAAAEALATAATGDDLAARAALERMREMPLRIAAALESEVRLLELDTEAWLGAPNRRSTALDLARWCAERGARGTELEALHRTVVTGAAEPWDAAPPAGRAAPPGATAELPGAESAAVLARIVELGELVHGPRAAALVRHAQAVADGDAGLTHIALRELGEAGLWLPAQGSRRVALTRREREIAGLAAGGLSSKAIAERFTLSVRTVDSHLSRVFTKLGVRSRRELAAALQG